MCGFNGGLYDNAVNYDRYLILSKCILRLFIDHYEVYSTDSELLSMITISCGVWPMILSCTIRCALFGISILKRILHS